MNPELFSDETAFRSHWAAQVNVFKFPELFKSEQMRYGQVHSITNPFKPIAGELVSWTIRNLMRQIYAFKQNPQI